MAGTFQPPCEGDVNAAREAVSRALLLTSDAGLDQSERLIVIASLLTRADLLLAPRLSPEAAAELAGAG